MKVDIFERRKSSGGFKILFWIQFCGGDVIGGCRRGNDLAKLRAHVQAEIVAIRRPPTSGRCVSPT